MVGSRRSRRPESGEEAFLRAAGVQGELGRLCRDGNRQWWYRFNVHEEFKETSDANVGAAIHHRWSGPQGRPCHCAVDLSSDASIGSFVTVKATDLWQANDTRDTVHWEPVCDEVIGHERGRLIECHRDWELKWGSRRCWADEDPGVRE